MNHPSPAKVVVKYENATALYAGQTIVNRSADEVIIDFSSGPVAVDEQQVLPIHTRIAMSGAAAERLMRLLQQATNSPDDANHAARFPAV